MCVSSWGSFPATFGANRAVLLMRQLPTSQPRSLVRASVTNFATARITRLHPMAAWRRRHEQQRKHAFICHSLSCQCRTETANQSLTRCIGKEKIARIGISAPVALLAQSTQNLYDLCHTTGHLRNGGRFGDNPLASLFENLFAIRASSKTWHAPRPAGIGTEVLAGVVASLVTLAHCLSFSALIFSGDLRGGVAFGLWGFMVASAVSTLVATVTTMLPPVLAGPRNPVVAVMAVLAADVAAGVLAEGGSHASALAHALLALSISGAVTGLALWLLGHFRIGQIARFVPFPVIAGFLAASGWLLITGGIALATGKPLSLATLPALTPADLARLSVAIVFATVVVTVDVAWVRLLAADRSGRSRSARFSQRSLVVSLVASQATVLPVVHYIAS